MPRGSPPATKSLRLLAAAGSLQQSRMTARKAAVDSPPPPVGPGAASGWRERTKGREKDGGRDGRMEGGGRREGDRERGRRREEGRCGADDHLFAMDCISFKFALVMQAATIFWCRSKASSSSSSVAVQFPRLHTNLSCTSWKSSGE